MGCSSSTSRMRGERSGTPGADGRPQMLRPHRKPDTGPAGDAFSRPVIMGSVLDHRVYRAAFLPALVALFVVAFSLTDPARPRTTRLVAGSFVGGRALRSAAAAPRRR